MSTSTAPIRFHFLDALRGFAIAGILLVNTADIMHLGRHGPVLVYPVIPPAANALYFLVATRFVPIFSFMFGMSMGFVIDSAVRRGEAGWKILLRRLGALVIIGLLNSILYPDEILLAYAIMGILALPVVLAVPRSWRLGLGLAAPIGSSAVGAATLFCLAAVCLAIPAQMNAQMRQFGANLIVVPVSAEATTPRITEQSARAAVRAAASTTGTETDRIRQADYRYETVRINKSPYLVGGIDVDAVRALNGHWEIEGRWPGDGEVLIGLDVAESTGFKVGSTVNAEYLGSDDLSLSSTVSSSGDTAQAAGQASWRVSGIVDTGGSEDDILYVPLDQLETLTGNADAG